MQENMDSSGRPGLDSNQVGQNTVTEEAVNYIEAINAGIDKYCQGYGLPISEHGKVRQEILNIIDQLENLDPKYFPKVETLRRKLHAAISSRLNAMLLAEEQTDEPGQLGPSMDRVQKVRYRCAEATWLTAADPASER
jgi:hypothetical protein